MRFLLALCTGAALLLVAMPASAEPGTAPGGVREAVSYPDADGLVVAPLDGGEQRNLGVVGRDEDWSPDGRRLAFVTYEGLFVVDVRTAEMHQIAETDRAGGPEWSPDGRWVVFTDWDSGRLTVVATDTPRDSFQPYGVTNPPTGTWDTEPAWSPDGTAIAFTRFDGSQTAQDVGVLDMTDFPRSVPEASLIVNRATVEAFPGLSWSPDSAWLTFSGLTPIEGSPIDIYVVDRAGTSLRLLVRDEPGWGVYDPVFSPIGDEIAYTRNGRSGGGSRVPEDGLYVVSVANPAERYQLVSTGGAHVNPADGRRPADVSVALRRLGMPLLQL